jgi:hypothetical protein
MGHRSSHSRVWARASSGCRPVGAPARAAVILGVIPPALTRLNRSRLAGLGSRPDLREPHSPDQAGRGAIPRTRGRPEPSRSPPTTGAARPAGSGPDAGQVASRAAPRPRPAIGAACAERPSAPERLQSPLVAHHPCSPRESNHASPRHHGKWPREGCCCRAIASVAACVRLDCPVLGRSGSEPRAAAPGGRATSRATRLLEAWWPGPCACYC